jgi:hypothetical protein
MRKTEPELMYREDIKKWYLVLDQTIHKDKSVTIHKELNITEEIQGFLKQIFDDMHKVDWKSVESVLTFRKKWGDL